jgi:hypothetical protein
VTLGSWARFLPCPPGNTFPMLLDPNDFLIQ